MLNVFKMAAVKVFKTRSTQRAQTSAEHGMTQLVNDVSIF